MGKQSLIQDLNSSFMKTSVPAIRTGHSVRVTQKIKEGEKDRLQVFEGLVIKVHNKSGDLNATVTVRKISEGVGVEKVFAIHAPNIVDIQIVKVAKIKRAKLYYMRDRAGKSARLQETQTTQTQRDQMMTHFEKLGASKEVATEIKEENLVETEISNDIPVTLEEANNTEDKGDTLNEEKKD